MVSHVMGDAQFMHLEAGNFKGEKVEDESMLISEYSNKHKLSKTRIYLLSKRKSILEIAKDGTEMDDDSEDFEVDEVYFPPFNSTSASSLAVSPSIVYPIPQQFSSTSTSPVLPSPPSSPPPPSPPPPPPLLLPPLTSIQSNSMTNSSTSLIGSAEERNRLRQEIDRAYNESLQADRAKSLSSQSRPGRQIRQPLRYRHSIGSPSLTHNLQSDNISSTESSTVQENDITAIVSDEDEVNDDSMLIEKKNLW